MKNKRQIGIVMDDGGGIAMAVYADKYAHMSDDGEQVADMIIAVMDGDNTSRWDNNQWGEGIMGDDYCQSYYGTAYQVAREIIRDYKRDNIYGANHEDIAIALIKAKKDGLWR